MIHFCELYDKFNIVNLSNNDIKDAFTYFVRKYTFITNYNIKQLYLDVNELVNLDTNDINMFYSNFYYLLNSTLNESNYQKILLFIDNINIRFINHYNVAIHRLFYNKQEIFKNLTVFMYINTDINACVKIPKVDYLIFNEFNSEIAKINCIKENFLNKNMINDNYLKITNINKNINHDKYIYYLTYRYTDNGEEIQDNDS